MNRVEMGARRLGGDFVILIAEILEEVGFDTPQSVAATETAMSLRLLDDDGLEAIWRCLMGHNQSIMLREPEEGEVDAPTEEVVDHVRRIRNGV